MHSRWTRSWNVIRDFSHLDLDQRLSVDDLPDPRQVPTAQSRAQVIAAFVARERPTLRQLLHSLAGARGHFTTAGTPEQIADLIEDWFTSGATDGFNVMPPILPAQLDVFFPRGHPAAAPARTVPDRLCGATRCATTTGSTGRTASSFPRPMPGGSQIGVSMHGGVEGDVEKWRARRDSNSWPPDS
jgi:hypothetical protein